MAIEVMCYCFPTFKDLLALPATPFFGSAKVRAYFISTKNFPNYFEEFLM